jgi:pSer/pThr/pTyr-binding forkhead associated (FHA) protein
LETKLDIANILIKDKWELKPTDGKKRSIFLRKKDILIGRSETSDIIINEAHTSTVHAKLTLFEDKVILTDLESSNGTFVNGKKVETITIKDGDQITFGNKKFVLKERKNVLPPTHITKTDTNVGIKNTALDIKDNQTSKIKNVIKDLEATKVIKNFFAKDKTPKAKAAPKTTDGKELNKYKDIPKETSTKVDESEWDASTSANITQAFHLLTLDYDSNQYIYEDQDDVFPIFDYEVSGFSLEVMIIANDTVLSIDYISEEDGKYYLVGRRRSPHRIILDSMGKWKKHLFLRVKDQHVTLFPIPDYKFKFFHDHKIVDTEAKSEMVVKEGDIAQFRKGNIRVFVRHVPAPPEVIPPPFFGRDKSLKKYIIFFLTSGFLFWFMLLFVDRPPVKPVNPKKVSKILFKMPRKKLVKEKKKPKPKPEEKKVEKKIEKPKPVEPKKVTKKPPMPPKVKRPPKKLVSPPVKVAKPKPKKPKLTYKKMNFAKKLDIFGGSKSKLKSFNFAPKTKSKQVLPKNVKVTSTSALKMQKLDRKRTSLLTAEDQRANTSIGVTGKNFKKSFSFGEVYNKDVLLSNYDPEILRQMLLKYMPQFRHCYDIELDRQPTAIRGTIIFDFTIGASGRVGNAKINMPKVKLSSQFSNCTRDVLRSIPFPPPKGGGKVRVRQPINFEPRR